METRRRSANAVAPQTLIGVLEEQSRRRTNAELVTISGEGLTYGETFTSVRSVASGLVDLGLRIDDRVAIISGNRIESLLAWLGTAAAGGVDVPMNAEWRGNFLRYVFEDADPSIVIGSNACLDELSRAIGDFHGDVVVIGTPPTRRLFATSRSEIGFDALIRTSGSGLQRSRRAGDLATIMYTSGTTGSSKGVMIPHGYYPGYAVAGNPGVVIEGTTLYCAQPLYHTDCRTMFATILVEGGRLASAARFSAHRFWEDVRKVDADIFTYIGAMLWMLHKQPPLLNDRDQPARWGIGSSAPMEIWSEFEERFGITLFEGYGMTESNPITKSDVNSRKLGSVGKPIAELQVRVVDAEDRDVAPGETGEVVFRPKVSNLAALRYWKNDAATTMAMRNRWFHTGDLLRVDEDGFFFYRGRLKDAIRRRGENVSAWEVERACLNHDKVLEAAAIGVPSPFGEEDIAVFIVTRGPSAISHTELHAFLANDLPRFAVPRYIEFVSTLPRTPSQRVEKEKLKLRGLGRAAWDAEAEAGSAG